MSGLQLEINGVISPARQMANVFLSCQTLCTLANHKHLHSNLYISRLRHSGIRLIQPLFDFESIGLSILYDD